MMTNKQIFMLAAAGIVALPILATILELGTEHFIGDAVHGETLEQPAPTAE